MAGGKVRWAAAFATILLIGIQFVPVERSNPPVAHDLGAPPRVDTLLRGACYDCHSHETRWPWYSRVAPFSWLVVDDVKKGRRELNFSAWPVVDFEAQDLLLREIADELSEDEMPPRSYRLVHPEARLIPEQVEVLLGWARGE